MKLLIMDHGVGKGRKVMQQLPEVWILMIMLMFTCFKNLVRRENEHDVPALMITIVYKRVMGDI